VDGTKRRVRDPESLHESGIARPAERESRDQVASRTGTRLIKATERKNRPSSYTTSRDTTRPTACTLRARKARSWSVTEAACLPASVSEVAQERTSKSRTPAGW